MFFYINQLWEYQNRILHKKERKEGRKEGRKRVKEGRRKEGKEKITDRNPILIFPEVIYIEKIQFWMKKNKKLQKSQNNKKKN